MLDDRSKLLMKALVEHYIADGQPVGSRTLSKASGLELSPATIRNVMSDLEELGLIASPHTSAGRIPTARGYRLFAHRAARLLRGTQPDIGPAAKSHLQRGQPAVQPVAVCRCGDCTTAHFGVQAHRIHAFVRTPLAGHHCVARWRCAKPHHLHRSGLHTGPIVRGISETQDEVVISGERNLFSVSDFSSDMGHLRRAFELFEQKTQLMRLMDVAGQAEGVRIFIGGESQVVPFEDLSIVSSPYEVDGKVVGTLGVIGPTRMAYDRMIQIVDITSKLVSNALSHHK